MSIIPSNVQLMPLLYKQSILTIYIFFTKRDHVLNISLSIFYAFSLLHPEHFPIQYNISSL